MPKPRQPLTHEPSYHLDTSKRDIDLAVAWMAQARMLLSKAAYVIQFHSVTNQLDDPQKKEEAAEVVSAIVMSIDDIKHTYDSMLDKGLAEEGQEHDCFKHLASKGF